jgi:CheY-like chemotaxis protein
MSTGVLSNYNFMILDDHPYVRSILQGVLRKFGQKGSVVVSDIQEAIEKLHLMKTNPAKVGVTNLDLIFVDYRLSGSKKTGWDFVRYIRKSPDSPDRFMRIVGITSFADMDILSEGRDAGVNGVIAKPFTGKGVYNQVLDTINDNRPYLEYEDGSYFGPERYKNRKSMDRGEDGKFFPGVKVIQQKKISQKMMGNDSPPDEDIFLDINADIMNEAKGRGEGLKDMIKEMQKKYVFYKGCTSEKDRVSAMKELGQAAHMVRDLDAMFLYPMVGKVTAYVERMSMLEGISEHKHTSKILEGLLSLQDLMMVENQDSLNKTTVQTILLELEKLMRRIARSLSPDAEDRLFMGEVSKVSSDKGV